MADLEPAGALSRAGAQADAQADEAELVARMAAGDHDAPLADLYDRYASRLYGLGLRLLHDPGLAEELVQETFVRLWRSADRFDPQRGSVRGFLFTIARRRAVDLMRRPSSRPLDPPSEPGGALDQSFDRALLEVSVREAMTALSEEHRQVLELVYDEDLSQRQIAERVGVPLGTVKTRTFYALRALKGVLDDRGMHA